MKYFAWLSLVLVACNPVTVVPIDDEDAGDGGTETEASTPPNDASADTSSDTSSSVDAAAEATTDAGADASDASGDG